MRRRRGAAAWGARYLCACVCACAALAVVVRADGADGAGPADGEHGAWEAPDEQPEEYEYIETPDMASTGTFRSERVADPAAVQDMRVMIEHPSEGFVYEDAQVTIHVNAANVPAGEGYSGMLYFGAGNPFPIPMDSVPVGITVTDLAPGNYSVKFMLLDADRQPTGVEADVNFERRAPPGFRAPKPDNSKFDSRVFEISQRFILAEQADPMQDKNPFRDALRALAKDNSECRTCEEGELSEADEVLAQAIPLLMGVKGRDVEQALEMLAHCADLGNVNCRFLHLSLAGIHERLGLFGDQAEGYDLADLERCATEDKSVLCRLALGFRFRHGLFSSGGAGAGRCDMAATHYRLAADHAIMFSQEDAGSGPLHSVSM